jgi:predicted RNA binding protein YcfA (HicA-like mRNA interferase family)
MSKRDKLIAALSNRPNNVTFLELRALLEIEGFTLERVTGSHHIFNKGEITFVIPVHKNRVKSIYIKRVLDLIEDDREGETE